MLTILQVHTSRYNLKSIWSKTEIADELQKDIYFQTFLRVRCLHDTLHEDQSCHSYAVTCHSQCNLSTTELDSVKNNYKLIKKELPPGGAGPLNFVFSGNKAMFPSERGAESDEWYA